MFKYADNRALGLFDMPFFVAHVTVSGRVLSVRADP